MLQRAQDAFKTATPEMVLDMVRNEQAKNGYNGVTNAGGGE